MKLPHQQWLTGLPALILLLGLAPQGAEANGEAPPRRNPSFLLISADAKTIDAIRDDGSNLKLVGCRAKTLHSELECNEAHWPRLLAPGPRDYLQLLQNQLLIANALPRWERVKQLRSEVTRLAERIVVDHGNEGLVTKLREKKASFEKEIVGLLQANNGFLKKLTPNFELYEKLAKAILNPGQHPLEVDEEETLGDYRIEGVDSARSLVDLLRFPFAPPCSEPASASGFLKSKYNNDWPVAYVPSSHDASSAELRRYGKNEDGIFTIYDEKFKEVKSVGIPGDFVISQSTSALVEIGKDRYLVVGKRRSDNAAAFALLEWKPAVKEIGLTRTTLADIPELISAHPSENHSFVIGALNEKSAWLLEMDGEGKLIRKKKVFEEPSDDFKLSNLVVIPSAQQTLLSLNRSRPKTWSETVLVSLSDDWSESWKKTLPTHSRIHEGVALPHARFAIVGSTRFSIFSPTRRYDDKSTYTWMQVLDTNGDFINAIEWEANREIAPPSLAFDSVHQEIGLLRRDKKDLIPLFHRLSASGALLETRDFHFEDIQGRYFWPVSIRAKVDGTYWISAWVKPHAEGRSLHHLLPLSEPYPNWKR